MKRIILSFIVSTAFIMLSGCEFSATSAHVENVKVCVQGNSNKCNADNPNFSNTTPGILLSCELKNSPENTKVQFAWYYIGQKKILIDAVTVDTGNRFGTLNLHSSLSKPTNGWPKGEYEVVITIVDTKKEPVVKKFTVQ
ncbi:MAG: hypothetical protein JXR65_03590 [Bacteroidales bacterium]|nr:hypothetical protein [Bacteroidales bacterium]